MTTNFPTSLDSFTNPTSGDNLNTSVGGRTHPVMHADINDAVAAIQAKLGINSSAVTTSHDYKLSAVTGTAKAVSSADARLNDGGDFTSVTYLFDDFVTRNGPFGTAARANNGAGSGYDANLAADGATVGGVVLFTGSTTSGSVTLGINNVTDAQGILFGFGTHVFQTRKINFNALSDGTDTYTFRIGFGDVIAGDFTDGAYFSYTHSASAGNWECKTASNSTKTTTDSGVAATTGVQTLKIVVNAAGTSVDFYINASLVATHTTNIPTSSGRVCTPMSHIVKSAGTTNRQVALDYMFWSHRLTTAR